MVRLEHNLRVAGGIKSIAKSFQLVSHFIGIVNFAVVSNNIIAEAHGLRSALGVNYRKAAVNNRRRRLNILPLSVRPSVF